MTRRGYNAFPLIYRPDARSGSEDLARAIAYLHEHAAEIDVFEGLNHGFGLGEGTIAEGWIDHAIVFWERQRA